MGDSYFRRHYPEDERMSDGELFKKYSGLLPEFGRVVCVSAGFITGDERKIQSFTKGGEGDILKETVNLLNRVHKLGFFLCGHNIKTFDLPYLGKRMLINKIFRITKYRLRFFLFCAEFHFDPNSFMDII